MMSRNEASHMMVQDLAQTEISHCLTVTALQTCCTVKPCLQYKVSEDNVVLPYYICVFN